jgi:hypothetical protein
MKVAKDPRLIILILGNKALNSCRKVSTCPQSRIMEGKRQI